MEGIAYALYLQKVKGEMAKTPSKIDRIIIGYLPHECGPEKPRMRLHLPHWPNDSFEIVDFNEFEIFNRIGSRMGLIFIDLEANPDCSLFKSSQ